MRSKMLSVAAAIAAGTLVGSVAFSQSQETAPPSSTTQGSMPQDSSQYPSQTGPSSTPGDMAGATSDESATAMGPAQIDQKKVEQFADAYVEVQTIQQRANADLESATDPAQADQLKTTAQSDMIAAVERSGLKVEEFNQIVANMAADTELRTRVSAEVQKRVGGTGASESGT
jgi:hypothetical protein